MLIPDRCTTRHEETLITEIIRTLRYFKSYINTIYYLRFLALNGTVASIGGLLKKIQCWLPKQHMVLGQGLTNTQRQARELVSGPSPTPKTRLLYFNRMQSRVVTGLLTGHKNRRISLYIM